MATTRKKRSCCGTRHIEPRSYPLYDVSQTRDLGNIVSIGVASAFQISTPLGKSLWLAGSTKNIDLAVYETLKQQNAPIWII